MVKRNNDLSRQERQDQERQENQRLVGHKYTSIIITIGILYKSKTCDSDGNFTSGIIP